MSTKSSFREQLERRDDMMVEFQASSFSPADVLIQISQGLAAPVSFALLLKDNGLSLSEAHAAATKLAAERSIQITLHPRSLRSLLGKLEKLGLTAYAVRDTGRVRVLVPAALVPPDVQASGTKSVSALKNSLSTMTIGDLRRVYGKSFAHNYKSSARLSDILYSLDAPALETIAAHESEVRAKPIRRKARVS